MRSHRRARDIEPNFMSEPIGNEDWMAVLILIGCCLGLVFVVAVCLCQPRERRRRWQLSRVRPLLLPLEARWTTEETLRWMSRRAAAAPPSFPAVPSSVRDGNAIASAGDRA